MTKSKTDPYPNLRQLWRSMKRRCEDPSVKNYAHYGARGIKVCQQWHDFDVFRDWALHHGYRQGLTIDRISNQRGYNPRNCRWVSRRAQAYNRGTNHLIKIDGEVHTLQHWCEHFGIPVNTVCMRVQRGWDLQKAITTPVGKKVQKKDQKKD